MLNAAFGGALRRWLEQQIQAEASDLMPDMEMMDIDDEEIGQQTKKHKSDPLLSPEIARDMVQKDRIEALIRESDELDDHHAKEACRLASMDGTGRPERRGRPRKQRSEILAETAKLLRDRIMTCDDQTNKLNRSLTQCMVEAEAALKTLPQAVVAVLDNTKEEVKAQVHEIEMIKEELSKIDVKEVSTESDEGEAMKKTIADMMKPVSQTHIPAGNRSVAAFRASWRHALNLVVFETRNAKRGVEIRTLQRDCRSAPFAADI